MDPLLLSSEWQAFLGAEAIRELAIANDRVAESEGEVYPPIEQRLRLFHALSPAQVRVVILGQDPYHNPGEAHGFSFSVSDSVNTPPSLRNIFKEYADDLGYGEPSTTDLSAWVAQGVFLLNSALSVPKNTPGAHLKTWERFTDAVIEALGNDASPKVFILWGKPAQAKRKLINEARHSVLTAPHPSPLSAHRGFFGSRPFSSANNCLKHHGKPPVEWRLPSNAQLDLIP